MHPKPDDRAAPKGALVEIRRSDTPEQVGDRGLQAVANRLKTLQDVARIGALGGDEGQLFGDIEDVALDPRGHVVVLDRQAARIRAYDLRGAFLYEVGRAGRGPGEFDDPRAITVDQDGALWVADWPKLKRFLPEDSVGFSYRSAAQPDLVVWRMCAVDHRLYASGMRLGPYRGTSQAGDFPAVIHVMTVEGQILSGFGEVYRATNHLVQEQMLEGANACVPAQDMVVYASDDLGEVRGWSTSGQPAWTTMLSDFQPLYWEETEDGGDQPVLENPWETVRSLTLVPPDHLLIQVGLLTDRASKEGRGDLRLSSYIIDAATGRGAYVGSDIPLLVLIDDSIAIGKQSVPFPQLHIYDFTGRQEDP